jgi:hypothetical protein
MSYLPLITIAILIILGCYYYQTTTHDIEKFKDYKTHSKSDKKKSADYTTNPYILIYQDKLYWLINTKKNMEPDVNPKVFSKIDDYKKYSHSNGLPLTKITKKSSVPKFIIDMTINKNEDEDIKFNVGTRYSFKNRPVSKKTVDATVYDDVEVAEEEEAGVKLSDWIDKIEDKLKHQQRNKYHMQPNKGTFAQYGQSFMPPSSWSVPQKRPPPCIPQEKCAVCPSNTGGGPAEPLANTAVGSIMPKFTYKEEYNKDYYYPGWIVEDNNQKVKDYPVWDPKYSMSQKFVAT